MHKYINNILFTYTYMIFALSMYNVHTCTWIYVVVCSCYRHVHRCWYMYVHRCWYMYGHCTHTSVHVHNLKYTSFPIIPDQSCDAGESLLRAGASPSELPPSWHQSLQLTDHPGAASASLCRPRKPVETTVYTMYIHCTYMVHIWFIHWPTMYMCTDYTMLSPLRQFPLRTRL